MMEKIPMMEKKRILCFGDSNTWGCIPRWEASPLPSERYDENTRWPRVMARELGPEWTLLEEGLGGRTTIFDALGESYRRGDWYLHPCLLSHRPLNYVVLMLGTNDIQPRLHPGPFGLSQVKEGMRRLIEIIRDLPECGAECGPERSSECDPEYCQEYNSSSILQPPKILLIAPPPIRKAQGRPEVWEKYGKEQGNQLSGEFGRIYKELSQEMQCGFLDAADYAQADLSDGVHFTRESHPRLGAAAAEAIREMEKLHGWEKGCGEKSFCRPEFFRPEKRTNPETSQGSRVLRQDIEM